MKQKKMAAKKKTIKCYNCGKIITGHAYTKIGKFYCCQKCCGGKKKKAKVCEFC